MKRVIIIVCRKRITGTKMMSPFMSQSAINDPINAVMLTTKIEIEKNSKMLIVDLSTF